MEQDSLWSRGLEYARHGNVLPATLNRLGHSTPRVLLRHPMPGRGGHSARRINKLLERLPRNDRYLEIGLERGLTFENVRAPVRWGVDPKPAFDLRWLPRGVTVIPTTSDEFFHRFGSAQRYDLVFIDGLHTFRQAYRDLINSCLVCPRGVLLVDDVVPCDAVSAMPDREAADREHERQGLARHRGIWHGDVFKVLLCLSRHHPELAFRTIVGSDNPQALVWRSDRDIVPVSAGSEAIDEVDRSSFEEVFGTGVPHAMLPRAEDGAIAEALAGLT